VVIKSGRMMKGKKHKTRKNVHFGVRIHERAEEKVNNKKIGGDMEKVKKRAFVMGAVALIMLPVAILSATVGDRSPEESVTYAEGNGLDGGEIAQKSKNFIHNNFYGITEV
jgi:hypothetical protein